MESGAGMRLVRNAAFHHKSLIMSSYQVLARKWRPQNFADMIGQDHVLRALVNALDNQRIHHAYLFTGMRGVGKTTIARIFAKCLNCETKGVSAEPCGTCSACVDIDAGRFFDLIEVDAASRTKVDETRELLENVPYAPASGRYKVYLIDEVHMFSTHSFNALLKTLEEPPEHVKFLLATTDPQKVPVTVLSRCLQFNLKRMPATRLADYLSHILDTESMAHDKPALDLIARAADGSVRDSLSLVEQAAAFGGGEVRANDVESMLGRVSTDRLIELISTLAEGDAKTLFEQVEALAEYAPDYVQITGEMLSLLHGIAMLQTVPESADNDQANTEQLQALAQRISAEELQLFYQIGQHARRDMPHSSDQREAFDMALMRMMAFAPQTAESTNIAASNSAASAGGASGAANTNEANTNEANTKDGAVKNKAAPATASDKDEPAVVAKNKGAKKTSAELSLAAAAMAAANAPDDDKPAKPEKKTPVKPSKPKPTAVRTPTTHVEQTQMPTDDIASVQTAPSSDNGAKLSDKAIDNAFVSEAPSLPESLSLESINAASWPDTIEKLGLSGMPKQLASQCVVNTREGTTLHLQIEEAQSHLHTAQFSARLQTALSERTRSDVTIDITPVEGELQTPARIDQKNKDDALAAARVAIDEDPMVKQLLSSVDGVVDINSVQPVAAQPAATKSTAAKPDAVQPNSAQAADEK